MSTPTPAPAKSGNSGRPAAGRHGSSWMNRLHRRHDAKHYRQSQEEQAPLLANGSSNTDTEAQQPGPVRVSKIRSCPSAVLTQFKSLWQAVESGGFQTYQFFRRNLKQILLAAVLALLTLFIALSLGFITISKGHKQCTSPACIHAASDILYNLHPKYSEMNACENFDELVCGGFPLHHDLRPDQGDTFTGVLMAEEAQAILRRILESDGLEVADEDKHNFETLDADYKACMDEDTIKSLGLAPLQALTEHIKLLYPTSSQPFRFKPMSALQQGTPENILSDHGVTDPLVYMMEIGLDAFISSGVGADDKSPDTQVIFVNPLRRIGLPSKEYYKDATIVSDYQHTASAVMKAFFKSDGNSSTILTRPGLRVSVDELVQGVVEFEAKIAEATPPEEDQNDITKAYNPMTVDEVEKILPQISMSRIISRFSPADYKAEKIIVGSPAYLKDLSKAIAETPKEILQAYMVWKTIQSYASRIEDPIIKPLRQFNNKLGGKDADAVPDRWRTCINAADQDLGWILSKFYVDKAFSTESKEFGDKIVSDIKDSFVTFLKDATWMTDSVRERAIKKVHAIDQKIGYPTSNPDILDPVALERFYKDLHIENTTHFGNLVEVAKFEARQEWSKLGKPTRHDEWGMTVPTVNAYYNPAGNEIVFPAGIMQNPVFYEPTVPQYLSYGAFGAVSGHELSHAFDNTGSQYDETGAYSEWWDNQTRVAFERKTSCFVDQYEKFTVEGPDGKKLHVNGKLTLGENVADAGGIHAAFKAWKKMEKKSPGALLPGLEHFTKDQLFFVNYANWWCGMTTKETAVQRIYLDPHAPKSARITGTMANSEDFRKAFHCPSKKPTCDLW